MTPKELQELERLAEERAKRRARARNYVQAPLHPKQTDFCARRELDVLYGGAAGGGKTEALLADHLQWISYPRYSGLILRRTYQALNLPGSIMNRAKRWIPLAFWNDNDKRFTFPSGATIQFGFCDSAGDLTRYLSSEFHRVSIDELTEWPEEWVRELISRIRRNTGDDLPLGFRAGTNPGGLGQEWVRARYGIPEGEVVSSAIAHEGRLFLPARAEDNPTLDLASYELSLKELGPARYEQLRWGRWVRDGEGLVYAEFTSANAIERPDWLVPGKCQAILAQDYGVTAATSFSVLAYRDHDPNVYVALSCKLTGLTPSENAERVEQLDAEWHFQSMVGDLGGLGKGFAEEARKRFSLPIEAADKNNKRGYIDLLNGDLKRQRILVVASACGDLIREWKTLPWDEGRREEAKGFANHCADGVLYGWRRCVAYHNKAARKPQTAAEQIQAETRKIWEDDERELNEQRARERDEQEVWNGPDHL